MNIAQLLMEGVTKRGGHPAIRFGRQTVTYDALNRRVDSLAWGLVRLGVTPGDVCVLMMPNAIEWVVVYFALAKVGAVVLPVHFLYREGELLHILKDSGARVFIGHGDHLEQPRLAMKALPRMNLVMALRATGKEGVVPLEQVFAPEEEAEFPVRPVDDDELWAIIYTSGTTGPPKGAMLSHGNLISNARTVAGMRLTRPDDVVLGVLPLYHIYGQTCVLNASLCAGLTIRLWPQLDTEGLLHAIETEGSSFLIAVPTILVRLLELSDHRRPRRSGLRFCISGAASLPADILSRFQERFETVVYEGYGLTECSPVCVENPQGPQTRPGSIGVPIPGFEARIVDEGEADVPVGEVGELIIRGPGVMKGYLNQPEATARTLRNGWLRTGDLARMDKDGFIYIVDRKKNLIIRGGYNVYPREIEEILYSHPKVAEAAVIGVPHPELGEEVAAAVVLNSGERASAEELQGYVKERVAPYKYPRRIYLMDRLPKSHTGKILKRAIRLKAPLVSKDACK